MATDNSSCSDSESYESYEPLESSESSGSSSSDLPENTLSVRYSMTTPEEHPQLYALALKAEVIRAIGYPDHIFVFQRSKETTEGSFVDEFIQVASPLECEEVPENAPDFANNMPYYRAKEVTIYFRNMDDLLLARKNIGNDIAILTKTYDTLNSGFDRQETIAYGK